MPDAIVVDIFVEDRAHEAFLVPLLRRIADDEQKPISARVRSARGGHGRAIEELKLYQRLVMTGSSAISVPDLLIVGIDGNCSTFNLARQAIRDALRPLLAGLLVAACPDPHIERWYLADPDSFAEIVGQRPTIGKRKCARDHYKELLSKTVLSAGHPPTLGGTEFAQEIAEGMDLYRAGRNDRSFKAFVDELRGKLRTFSGPNYR